jgi:RNA polymerase sigma factor (sigma-70 family)
VVQGIEKKLDARFEREDLIAEGNLALVRAAETYIPTQALPFYRYAQRKIRSAVYDSVRRRKWRETTGDWSTSGDKRDNVQVLSAESVRQKLEPTALRSSEQLATDGEQRRDIAQAMKSLSPNQAKVIMIHYYKGETIRSAEESLNLPKSYGRQLHGQALRIMRENFRLQGRTAA